MHSWNPFRSISNKHQEQAQKIDFVSYITTCLFWRKPGVEAFLLAKLHNDMRASKNELVVHYTPLLLLHAHGILASKSAILIRIHG